MKEKIGFLLCTAFYGIFFIWAMIYGDENVPLVVSYVLFFAPGIFMVIFSSVFSLLCLDKCRFGWALGVWLGILFLILWLTGSEDSNIGYYIYLVVLWILSLGLSFVETDSGEGGSSGSSRKSWEWDVHGESFEDYINRNL